MKTSLSQTEKSLFFLNIYRLGIALLIFLIPLKFSQQYHALSEFSLDSLSMIFLNWPPVYAFLLIGSFALFNAFLFPQKEEHWTFTSWGWLGLGLAMIPAWVNHTQTYEWLSYVILITSAWLLSWQISRWLRYDSEAKNYLKISLALITFILVLWAWWQRPLGGLALLEKNTLANLDQLNMPIEPGALKRLQQRRAYGPFGYPNTYAAFLLLTSPMMLLMIWEYLQRIMKSRIVIYFIFSLMVGLTLGALLFSESRTVFPAIIFAVIIYYGAWKPWDRQQLKKIIKISLLAIPILFGLIYIVSLLTCRDPFSTFYTRLGYWRGALKMFAEYPLWGVGWGEFYPHFLRLKMWNDEMVQTPHQFILKFASQCGIIGLGAALFFLFSPVYSFYKNLKMRSRFEGILFVSILAFLSHSLADFNFWYQSPILILAILLVLFEEKSEKLCCSFSLPAWWRKFFLSGILLAVCIEILPILIQGATRAEKEQYLLLKTMPRWKQTLLPLDYYLGRLRLAQNQNNREKVDFYYRQIITKPASHHAWLLLEYAEYQLLEKQNKQEAKELLTKAKYWGKGDKDFAEEVKRFQTIINVGELL